MTAVDPLVVLADPATVERLEAIADALDGFAEMGWPYSRAAGLRLSEFMVTASADLRAVVAARLTPTAAPDVRDPAVHRYAEHLDDGGRESCAVCHLGPEHHQAAPECDGRCTTATDLGIPEYEPLMHMDPACSLHGEAAPDGDDEAEMDRLLDVFWRAAAPGYTSADLLRPAGSLLVVHGLRAVLAALDRRGDPDAAVARSRSEEVIALARALFEVGLESVGPDDLDNHQLAARLVLAGWRQGAIPDAVHRARQEVLADIVRAAEGSAGLHSEDVAWLREAARRLAAAPPAVAAPDEEAR